MVREKIAVKVDFADSEFKQIADYLVKKNKQSLQEIVDEALAKFEKDNSEEKETSGSG